MSETGHAGKTATRLFSAGGLLVVLAILIFINIIVSLVNLRIDTTEDGLYSLSDGSRRIIDGLEQDVQLRFFYTPDVESLPVQLKNYARRAADFLAEYENAGAGRITLETISPKPDSDEEEWAAKYGIKGTPLPTGDTFYLGVVALSADQEETIPMLDPTRENQLEYDLTRIISRVQAPRQLKISIMSGLPVFGAPGQPMMGQNRQEPWLFIKELKKNYEVVDAAAGGPAPDTDLLMVIHPRQLSDPMLYAIDQYILRGGNALVFVDPLAVSDASPGQDKASDLKKLFDAWGIEMVPAKVVTDFNAATRLRGQNGQVEENPMWLSMEGDAFNRDPIITGQLDSMLLAVAGAIRKKDGCTLAYEPLLSSSFNSSLTDAFMARFGGGPALRKDFKATADRYDLAVSLNGKFPAAFSAGAPKDAKPADGAVHLAEAEKAATVVVISDVDLLFDAHYVTRQNFLGFQMARMFNDNLNFVLNAAETLTGSEALISIRSRGSFQRPFTVVRAMEKQAQDRWMSREQELMRKVDETNAKLRKLQSKKDDTQKLILSPEQETEIKQFREEKIRINKELKEVRRNLRGSIEFLGHILKFINIFGVVILLGLTGLALAIIRGRNGAAS
ncbi:MAG: hypothetical protein CSB33_05360 [Desulfobacterales bacterium]|nr:MAG: hypothetical protein CSB33_05360 [Desulfobacterales bacterium]